MTFFTFLPGLMGAAWQETALLGGSLFWVSLCPQQAQAVPASSLVCILLLLSLCPISAAALSSQLLLAPLTPFLLGRM